MSACRSCQAEIAWVVIAKSGKKMPLDLEPCTAGNVVYSGSLDASGLPFVDVIPMRGGGPLPMSGDRVRFPSIAQLVDPVGEVARFRSHFATCAHGVHRSASGARREPGRST